MHARFLLLAVHCNLYFDSHSHSLYRFDIASIRNYDILCMKHVYQITTDL